MRGVSAVVVMVVLAGCLDTGLPPPPGAGAVTGRVLVASPGEPLGAPVEGATVTLVEFALEVRTTEDGRFTLTPLPSGEGTVEISAGALKRVFPLRGLNAGPGRVVSLGDVSLTRNASVQGEVQLEGGGALEGTLVFLEGQVVSTYTTPSGGFVLRELPVGPGVLSVYREGFVPQSAPVELRSGERTVLDAFTLKRAEPTLAQVSGRALLEGRDDASSITLSSGGKDAQVSVAGEWSLALPLGVHSFVFQAAGHRPVTLRNRLIAADTTLPVVTLQPGEGALLQVTPFPAFERDAGASPDAGLDAGVQPADSGVPLVATRLTAGVSNTCALRSDGTAFCWGRDTFGQLFGPPGADAVAPVQVAADVVDLSIGGTHTCAARADAGVTCWGTNTDLQLGVSNSAPTNRSVLPIRARSVSCGARFCCAVEAAQVECWGANDALQSGSGAASNRILPSTMYNVTLAEAVAAGDAHTCVLMTVNGSPSVKCAGSPFSSGTVPGGVVLSDVKQLASGGGHTCAVKLDGTVFCWGAGAAGQLGFLPASMTPTQVPGLSAVQTVAAGGQHTCALLADGTLRCWGGNGQGQLGSAAVDGGVAQVTPPLGDVVGVAAGGSHTCAVQRSGAVWCWGNNSFFQLGADAGASSPAPVRVVVPD